MDTDPCQAFLARFARAMDDGTFVKLTLGKPRAPAGDLGRVTVRPVVLKSGANMCMVYSHATRDVTKNGTPAQARQWVAELLGGAFDHAHLHTVGEQIQLKFSKKGKSTLSAAAVRAAPGAAAHDRVKRRYVDLGRDYLRALGVANDQGQLVPSMASKWKQINKFVEIVDQAVASSELRAGEQVSVVDFGSGKGYLTFALHDYLSQLEGRAVQVTGLELRPDMVKLCESLARELDLVGLRFELGDVRTASPIRADIVIALHACDTATDHAIHLGVLAGASIIMCSPCCHKELRPQLLSPHALRPVLKHGVHLGQEAEMLTDGLRALLLEACGYETKVFEFISLEHTNKNKMILAVKRKQAAAMPRIWQQIDELKDFYGIQHQCLESLLSARRPAAQG